MIKKLFFLILILGMFGSIFLKDETFSSHENRMLQSLPEFSIDSLLSAEYTSLLDDYFSDQFPFRADWLRFHTSSERFLFAKNCINDVYLAKSDYLINRHSASSIDVAQIDKNINYLNEFTNRHSADVILVPTSSEVLKNILPLGTYHIDQSSYLANLDNLSSATDILYDKTKDYIYYKNDHHWTMLGAYYVYSEYVDSPIEYNTHIASDDFLGSIYRQINLSFSPDVLEGFDSKNEFNVTHDLQVETQTLYNRKALDTMDKYVYYLDGNHAISVIENKTTSSKEKLLIIKDSYANTFAPIIANDYHETHLIDLRFYNGSIKRYIEENNFDKILVLYNQINFFKETNFIKLNM